MQERYRTLRYRIWGFKSIGMQIDDSIGVELEEMFELVLRAFPYVRAKFGRRKSSPGYNFVYRRLLDLLGHWDYGVDFPPLKSRKKRADAVRLWRAFCVHLNWPYVNSDGTLFGAAFAVGPEEFDRGGRAVARNNKRMQHLRTGNIAEQQAPTEADTQSGVDRFRWELANGASEQDQGWPDFEDLPDFLFTCSGSPFSSSCGDDNVDSSWLQ